MNILLCIIIGLDLVAAQVPYSAVPRWGQATALLNDTIYVQGGKTDPQNSIGYSSAPVNNDLLRLSLSSPFDNSSVPWQLISSESNTSTSQGPAVAWHTLSAFNATNLLIFGGEGGPNNPPPTPSGTDSGWTLSLDNSLSPQFSQGQSWVSEPVRRTHHTAVTSTSGKVYVVGGQMADLSDNVFSDHFIFDPTVPSFATLPTENGPGKITRHGSVILSNGHVLVFGGYSPSTASLTNFSTVWSLDTNAVIPVWTTLNISSSDVPPGRRDFAFTLLPGSRVLIHGGIDGDTSDAYNQVLSDGWILDASQPAAVWRQVASLSELGPRFDHFAVAYGSTVIFGFGFQQNGPAPVPVQIYNSSGDGSWLPSYTPPPSAQTPTQTIPGQGQTSTAGVTTSPTGSSTATLPNPNDPGNNGGKDGNNAITGIAVGVSLGFLTLAGVAAVAFIILRKKRREDALRNSFMALRDADDDGPGHVPLPVRWGEKIGGPHAKERWTSTLRNVGPLALIMGPDFRSTAANRRDMLADEDTREFGSQYRRRQGSSWSLRSILGRRSREPSTSSVPRWTNNDPFSDGAALMSDEETGYVGAAVPGQGRPPARREYSYASTMTGLSYVDPFTDPIIEEEDSLSHHAEGSNTSYHPHLQIQTLLPLSTQPHVLSPVTEASRNTSSFGTPSVSSHTSSQDHPTPLYTSSGLTSMTSANSSSPRPSSMLDSTPSSSSNVRRSNSWWDRFARTSFLDRGKDANRGNRGIGEFRDPNPPPRLMAIEESQHSGSPENDKDSPGSQRSNSVKRAVSALVKSARNGGAHAKSTSSLRTADSEAIERMAGMDVVQHQRTGSSRTKDSVGTSIESYSDDPHWLPHESDRGVVTSPVDLTSQDHPLATEKATPTPSQIPLPESSAASSATSLSTSGSHRPPSSAAANVSSRVRNYEQRLSREMEVLPPINTKQREERARKPSRVDYGLVPRPSLFVANPDYKQASSSSID